MKNTLIALLVLMAASAQAGNPTLRKNTPPQEVEQAFLQKFPEVKKVKWHHPKEAIAWEADFKMNGYKYIALFSDEGTWIETEHEIKIDAVPESIKEMLGQAFHHCKIEKAEIAETPQGGAFEFEVAIGKNELEVWIDSHGTITATPHHKHS